MKRSLAIITLLIAQFIKPAIAVDREQAKKELEQVKQQIEQQKQLISQQKLDQKSIQNQLKQTEIQIAKTVKSLNQTQVALENNQQQIKNLQQQQKQLQVKQQQQQIALAAQIESAFMAGQHDYGKLLLNQDDLGKLERVISYYRYLNEARIGNIEAIKTTVAELLTVTQNLNAEQQRLTNLLETQRIQQQTLALQQKSREQTLASLAQQIDSDQQRLSRMIEEEQALVKLLEEVRELVSADIQLTGLSDLRGSLPWPTEGRVRYRFGNRKQGQVKWKGIYIDGKEGNDVNTIHQGRVLYADWLKGFGLLMVIDHGNDYMSLYGHNQALLKSAGDTVEAGEPIALLGQSGGQVRSGLYFEIRYQGKPINPTSWLKKT